jgi:hypothetical protein
MTTNTGVGINSVQILVDGTTVGIAAYGSTRADVCGAFPGRVGCPNVGFSYQLNATSLGAGSHTLTALATGSDGSTGSYSFTVKAPTPSQPVVFIDSLAPGATVSGTVTISGWALDSPTSIGTAIAKVQILVDGTAVGTATYGGPRPDVCGVYPGRVGCPNVGFTYQLNTAGLSAGTHTVTAVATDTDATPDSGSYSLNLNVVAAPAPAVTIDSPTSGTTISGTATISGWAIDNLTTIGTAISSVQIQVDGAVVGNATYGTARADVCAAYPGRPGCPNVGFSYQFNATGLNAGAHTLTVVANAANGSTGSSSISVTAPPPSTITINGPSTCLQGQVCNYTAGGGTPPYSYSMMSGSVGTINSSSGAYTAPVHITPKQVINGCQAFPNNSVFNTRVDNLPVHPNNALWMSNIDVAANSFGANERLNGSVVLSTDPSVPMNFVYSPNPPGGTNFIFQPFPDRVSEAGAAWTAPGYIPGIDNHFLTTYRDTCQQQEAYKYYQTGAYSLYPASNSASGVVYSLESNELPGWGTDAAGLPIGPLMIHQDELLAAAAGNIDAIQHAARFTLDSLSIAAARLVWPAQATASGGFCQGPASIQGFVWPITGNGSTTVTATAGNTFKPGWPAGMTIIIDSVNYTVVSVSADGLSMVVSSPISAGSHSMSAPDTNCPPYGTRFRLKSSFAWQGYLPTCDTGCKNVIQAIVRQQQRYGIVLADAGSSWGFESDGGIESYSVSTAAQHLVCNVINCQFDGLFGNASNYEIVDESSLQTSQNQIGTDSRWMEARLNNGYVVPDGAAVVQVTDAASHTGYFSVALQGVAVGVPHPNEVVMAGASPFQLTAWVTGTSTQGYSCTLSPSGAGFGSITSGCLYTPPASNAVSTINTTTVTVTANADANATRTIAIQIVPVSSDGKLHLSIGKSPILPFTSFIDNNGIVWWNDMVQGLPISLFPDDYSSAGVLYEPTWSNYPGTDAYAVSALPIYWVWMGGYNDHHFRIHVPNGMVTGTVLPANAGANAPNIVGFSFDCNGQTIIGQTDLFSFTGAAYVGRPMTCSQVVSNGLLHMVVRMQGVNLSSNPDCGVPCYSQSSLLYGNLLGGVVVGSTPATGSGRLVPEERAIEEAPK